MPRLRPGATLRALALACGALAGLPLVYLAVRGLTPGAWRGLTASRLPSLAASSLGLAAMTTAFAVAVAVPMAWLVVRTDLPGRRLLSWLVAVPLVIPPYVGGIVYASLLAPGTAGERWLRAAGLPVPPVFSAVFAAACLALFTYPLVFVIVAAALRQLNPAFEEAARMLAERRVFRRVVLPAVRPGLAAGSLLVALYALSDFGVVTLLRQETFVSAVYRQITARYDRGAAAALSLLLVGVCLAIVLAEMRSRDRARFAQTGQARRPPAVVRLGWRRWPALAFVTFVLVAAAGLPLGVLAVWSTRAGQSAVRWSLMAESVNTLVTSAGAALLATLAAIPMAAVHVRERGFSGHVVGALGQLGYAMPGVVAGLGLVFAFSRLAPPLYGTVWIVVAAYVVRFLPQAFQALRSGTETVSVSLEEAARTLGAGPRATLRRVTLPLIAPSALAGWALVFLSGLKELTATLLLRPPGFSTLPVRIWTFASEGFYQEAALPALALVALSAVPLAAVLGRDLPNESP